jgi:predicted MFS family arabinose efflux permease
MWQALQLIISDRVIRIATMAVFCVGFTYASVVPYMSIIGVDQLGLSEAQYAVLTIVTAAMAMLGGITLGHFSDRARSRKTGILFALGIGCLGFGSFALWPSIWTFTACLTLFMPISGSAYGQLFVVIRASSNLHAPQDAVQINSIIRTLYAMSWIILPGAVGMIMLTRENVSDSFGIGALAFAFCFSLYWLFGKVLPQSGASPNSAWQSLQQAFTLIGSAYIFPRVLALAMIACVQGASMALLPLLITSLPLGNTAVVGWNAGLVAALEMPFMLLGGKFAKRFPLWQIIVLGGAVHAAYLLGLGFASSVHHIYGLAILNAAGGAIMLTLHLNYVQNLMPDRPGLGTSLLSIVALGQRCLGALVFALAGTWMGFAGAALVGAAIAVLGCVLLFLLDRSHHQI